MSEPAAEDARWRPIEHLRVRGRARLFAIDVDQTLITSDHRLSGATVAAVRHVRAQGAHVLLASSRPPRGMWPYLHALGLVDTERFVSLQGALIGRYSGSGRLSIESTQAMPLEAARQVVRLARRVGLAVGWYR